METFGEKLYLEFGGKLFDDYHASRVLPGFKSDAKLQMLLKIKNKVEIVIVINAFDIENSKARADIGVKYENEVNNTRKISDDLSVYNAKLDNQLEEQKKTLEHQKTVQENDLNKKIKSIL